MALKKIVKVGNAKDFLNSQKENEISGKVQSYIHLLEGNLFPKWVKAIYNYCMYTGDRVESLVSKGYSRKDISKMSDYFHPMVYRIVNTMYGYLLDKNFTITAHGGRKCGQDVKIQKNGERYWRQKKVSKNMMKIIKQAVLLGQCWGMPYVERVFGKVDYIGTKSKPRKKEYVEDYITAGLYAVSPFHLFYDPYIDRDEQEEVIHTRFGSRGSIKKELRFMTFGDGTKLKAKDKINYITEKEQDDIQRYGGRFCTYDYSRVRQVWRKNFNGGSIGNKLYQCLMGGEYDVPNHLDSYKIEKNNKIHERTFVFRKIDFNRHLAVFLNKKMVYDGPSPFGNYLPYVPIYYKEPSEGSVERGLGLLLEQPQEVVNNSYRAKHDSTRKNNINGSITIIQGNGNIKKNGKTIQGELELNKDDVIHVGKDVNIQSYPVQKINQNDQSIINDSNALGDYISNLNNVTGGQSSKITRVSGEVITKTQVTERELEPMIAGIEHFVTSITEIILQQQALLIAKKYKVFITGEEFEIDLDDLKGRYSWTWSTSRIDELYREFNAQKKEAALNLLLQVAPERINREIRAKEIACLGGLDENIVMSQSDFDLFKYNSAKRDIDLEIKLLQEQKRLAEERAKIFPPAPEGSGGDEGVKTHVNINLKDIPNGLVRQEILAEAGAESALQVDPMTLVSKEGKEALEKPVGFIETTEGVGQPGTAGVLVDGNTGSQAGNTPVPFDLAESV